MIKDRQQARDLPSEVLLGSSSATHVRLLFGRDLLDEDTWEEVFNERQAT